MKGKKRHSLAREIPEVVKGMQGLHDAVIKDGALTAKTKELICVGISVAIRCENCLRFHIREAAKIGATPAEIAEAAGTGILMGGGPASGYTHRIVPEELDRIFGGNEKSGPEGSDK